jgi:phosphatidate cytidylyltransferase
VAGDHPDQRELSGPWYLAGRNNLMLRLVSSLVLAPLAVAAAYAGGLVFLAFWTIAALIVLWEWDTLVCAHDRNPVLTIGVVALIGAALLMAFDWSGTAVTLVALSLFGVATLASRARR